MVLARAHLCLSEYSQALPLIEEGVSLRNETYVVNFYTAILIGLGETGKAMDVINESLQRKPSFPGYRYYLRGLID